MGDNHKLWVESFLKDHPEGISIEELSSKLKLGRQTVKVILSGLIGEDKVAERKIGQVKLHYWQFKKKEKK